MNEEQLIAIEDRTHLLNRIIADLQTDLNRLTSEITRLKSKVTSMNESCNNCCGQCE